MPIIAEMRRLLEDSNAQAIALFQKEKKYQHIHNLCNAMDTILASPDSVVRERMYGDLRAHCLTWRSSYLSDKDCEHVYKYCADFYRSQSFKQDPKFDVSAFKSIQEQLENKTTKYFENTIKSEHIKSCYVIFITSCVLMVAAYHQYQKNLTSTIVYTPVAGLFGIVFYQWFATSWGTRIDDCVASTKSECMRYAKALSLEHTIKDYPVFVEACSQLEEAKVAEKAKNRHNAIFASVDFADDRKACAKAINPPFGSYGWRIVLPLRRFIINYVLG